ncbi:DNA/RNA non-specific endonuclease [Phycicoccus sp. CSK15P-2]|uniref:DNA/RNA non-specific endonuclease n=1 Tax=Phycicoccus sp. CSK15P-2 TaxID=2807627 RepID=UPI00194FC0AF|nr:DNA/RNA non-specific endonuclease [Phycicoccus sp. CSK15P-2]MBM6403204.1 DNA/RNA non-specific endonuclease [Phycicoccus sp. CSK15P-2]
MQVAVLGTGLMGSGMARSLLREGHEVRVWNRTQDKAAPLADDGATVAGSVAEAVHGADVAVTMLFDADATTEVGRELLDALGPDAVWLQCGTVGVDGARRVAEMGGGRVLDAPVLGTRKPAEDGTLVVLLSGPPSLRERVAPVLEAVGSRTVVAGDGVGRASALKLACNSWVGLLTAGVAQALSLAETLDVDPRLFLEAIEGGPVDAPYAKVKGGAMLARDWTPSFEVDGVVKDLGLMTDAVRGTGFPTDLLEALHGLFSRASGAGHGADDMAAVRTVFSATLTGHDPEFLGMRVDPPVRDPEIADEVVLHEGRDVLDYPHFTVSLSGPRRLARWVAWDLDVPGLREDLDRDGLDFHLDPRVPAEVQTPLSFYTRNRLDRGHLARRRDVTWGPTDEAQAANAGSFTLTNIAPQMDDFNQGHLGGVWGLLEDSLIEHLRESGWPRATVYAGPVLEPDDPPYRDGIQVPQAFWKVVTYVDAGRVRARAFLATQDLDGLEPLVPPDTWATLHVPLATVESAARLTFDPLLRDASFAPAAPEVVTDAFAVPW